ncbi:MAG: hypothetical protein EZS28_040065, partial [Streblomastix strix]
TENLKKKKKKMMKQVKGMFLIIKGKSLNWTENLKKKKKKMMMKKKIIANIEIMIQT